MGGLQETEERHSTFVDNLRLEWQSDQYYGKHIVLVEGEDDVTFYSKLFQNNCLVKPTFGCAKLIEYHQDMDAAWTESCHIAIKDADFDRANGALISMSGFFYTDSHDHEMMAASSNSFMTELLGTCGCTSSVAVVQNAIFADLRVLSTFKWYNYTEHTHLSCDSGVDIVGARVQNMQNPAWLLAQYQSAKDNRTPGKVITASIADYQAFAVSYSTNDYDLTNGHDFFKRLCGGVNGTVHKQNYKEINKRVQTGYQVQHFRPTQLYADIAGWEASHVRILK